MRVNLFKVLTGFRLRVDGTLKPDPRLDSGEKSPVYAASTAVCNVFTEVGREGNCWMEVGSTVTMPFLTLDRNNTSALVGGYQALQPCVPQRERRTSIDELTTAQSLSAASRSPVRAGVLRRKVSAQREGWSCEVVGN